MDIEKLTEDWILASNSYDTKKYLGFYADEAILNDPSVAGNLRAKTV